MTQFKTLNIHGYRHQEVPNTFVRQDEESSYLGVVLPGFGYSADMPLLYYASEALSAAGADVLLVEYGYDKLEAFRQASQSEREAWIVADVTAALHVALAERTYRRITLVGKSLGTLAMGLLIAADPALEGATAIWLTPLLRNDALRAVIRARREPGLLVIGSDDSHYSEELLGELRGTSCALMVIPGADHSLEVPGDLAASVRILAGVTRAIEQFIRGS